MSNLEIHMFPYYEDNYGYLIHSADTGETIAMDAGECRPYLDAAEQKGWKITQIWITHHHWDHTDGLEELKKATGATVFGPKKQSVPIKGLDQLLDESNELTFAGRQVQIIETPGHTTDMLNFYIPQENMLFVGDTIMVLGCGRILEGTQPMMWDSLAKLIKLPRETTLYSCHEYALFNAQFALTIDPNNEALLARIETIKQVRADDKPAAPSTMEEELTTNPFLRPDDEQIRLHLGMTDATDAEVFGEIRTRRDNF